MGKDASAGILKSKVAGHAPESDQDRTTCRKLDTTSTKSETRLRDLQYVVHWVLTNEFRWESQNTDSHQGKGRRFVEQKSNGKKFLLFVRENKTDGYGNTSPFICFGLVDYICSKEDKPMKINWQTHQPILPQFLNAV